MIINIIIVICFACFLAILFLNVYFRVKVFKIYKRLINNRVEFDLSHFLNKEKLEREILPKYPDHKKDILTFVSHIRFSMSCAIALIILVTVLAAVLMFVKQ